METHDHDDEGTSGKIILPDDNEGDERWVECDYCDAELELSTDELAQGWYICSECGQLSHLAKTDDDDNKPALEFPTRESTADWVPLIEVAGVEAATLVVSYLRANGLEAYAWQQGAGRAFGLSIGSLGVSHIMVREDQIELARSLLESEAEAVPDGDETVDDSLSGASKAAMGLAAITLSPVGAGIAYGLSRAMSQRGKDRGDRLVECIHCGTALELSDQEVAKGSYICPECRGAVHLGAYVACPSCQSELELDETEQTQGWYRCPECDQVTQL